MKAFKRLVFSNALGIKSCLTHRYLLEIGKFILAVKTISTLFPSKLPAGERSYLKHEKKPYKILK